jgi:hypothetical protein
MNTKAEMQAAIEKITGKPGATVVAGWTEESYSVAYYSFQAVVVAQRKQKLPEATGLNLTTYEDLWKATNLKDAKLSLSSERNMTFDEKMARTLADVFDKRCQMFYADRKMTGKDVLNGLRPAASREAVFRINRDFKDVYNDLKNPETKLFTQEICKAIAAIVDQSNGKLIDCIILDLSPGSTIANVTLVYESDQIPQDGMLNPQPDAVDVAINSIKTSGKVGTMGVDPASLSISSKTNIDKAAEEARILKELQDREKRLIFSVTIPSFIGIAIVTFFFLLCTAHASRGVCRICMADDYKSV